MTKLTIYTEWAAFILQQAVMLFAILQANGVAYFSDPAAMAIVGGVLAFNTYLPTLAKNAQEFAAKLELLNGSKA